jgi:hypothetical protein
MAIRLVHRREPLPHGLGVGRHAPAGRRPSAERWRAGTARALERGAGRSTTVSTLPRRGGDRRGAAAGTGVSASADCSASSSRGCKTRPQWGQASPPIGPPTSRSASSTRSRGAHRSSAPGGLRSTVSSMSSRHGGPSSAPTHLGHRLVLPAARATAHHLRGQGRVHGLVEDKHLFPALRMIPIDQRRQRLRASPQHGGCWPAGSSSASTRGQARDGGCTAATRSGPAPCARVPDRSVGIIGTRDPAARREGPSRSSARCASVGR